MTYGDRIRVRRKELGLTMAEASSRIGKSKQQWEQWETGTRRPRIDLWEDIAAALHLTGGQLLEVEDE